MLDSMRIGRYHIKWVNEDYLEIVIDYGNSTDTATVCGGDMETLLSALFITTVKCREYKDEPQPCAFDEGAGE